MNLNLLLKKKTDLSVTVIKKGKHIKKEPINKPNYFQRENQQ